jgi:hypothetical protein
MNLAQYCEAMLYDYEREWRPEGTVELDRPDVLAWKRPGWPVGYSRVAYVKWTAEEADARIEELLEFFGDAGFHWHVGPSSTPEDLEARLAAHGIVEVADRDIARLSLQLAHHTGEDLERSLNERMAYLTLPTRRTHFVVVFLGDVPVANASYRWSSDGRCMYLTGAETAETYRGRGVYQTLISYRARLAHERGCEIVSILANRKTSAPILRRHAFADHGEQPRLGRPAVPPYGMRAVP